MVCDHDKSKEKLIAEMVGLRARVWELEAQVDKLKETEVALRNSEERYRLAMEAANDGVWDWNLKDNTGYRSPAYFSMLGYEPVELSGGHELWQCLVHPDDLPVAQGILDDYLQGRRPAYEVEFRMMSKSGAPVWVLSRGRITSRDADGTPLRFVGTHTDITSRKKAEDELRHSEAVVRRKLDAILSPEGDLCDLSLGDVLDAETLQALMDDFFVLMGIGSAIIDMDGKVLVSTGWQDICTKFHRVHPETCRNCVESDTLLSEGVAPGECKLYRCKNLMWDIATPIMAGNVHIGNIFLGQFFFENEEIDHEQFREQARRYGFDEEEYIAALDRAPRWSRDTVFRVMSFYAKLAEMLSRMSYANIKLARSVAERDRLLASLSIGEANLRSLFDAISESVFLMKADGEILAANKLCAERVGLTVHTVVGRCAYDILSPEVAARRKTWLDEVFRTGRPMIVEDERDGRFQRHSVYPVFNPQGLVDRVAVYSEDITEQRRAKEAFRESEGRFRRMVETAKEGVWTMNERYETTFVNRRMAEMLGYDPEEMLGQRVDSFMFPEDLDGHQDRMQKRRKGENQIYEHRFMRKDGRELITIVSANALVGEQEAFQGSFAMFTDITQLKRAQRELQQEKDKFKNILDTMNDGVYIVNRGHDIEYVNPVIETDYGPPAGRKCHEYFHDLSEPCPWCKNADVFAGHSVHWEWTSSKTGKSYDLFDCPLHNTDGTVSKLEIIHEVTDRKRAEKELRDSEERYRKIVDLSPDGVYVNIDDRVAYASRSLAGMLGYSTPDELMGRNVFELFHPDYHDIIRERIRMMRKNGVGVPAMDEKFVRSDGTPMDVEVAAAPIVYHGKHGAQVMVRDSTERKRAEAERLNLEAQLRQAQKMEAVGALAGGVAHDFNNLLQVVLGYCQLLLSDRTSDDADFEELSKIEEAATRGADLVRRLLTFGRKVGYKPVSVDLNEHIVSMRRLLARTISPMIDIKLSLDPALPHIVVDPVQMEQILMNLAINARDAMPDGGAITVRTTHVILDEKYCATHAQAKTGPHVLLSMSDTGEGMTQETMEHLFDPFFTTKEVGKGTGLGLAMVYGIVTQHGGHIRVLSQPGVGSEFRVYLPVLVGEETQEIAPLAPIAKGGSETILLVEDEPAVRNLGVKILERSGYKVVTAANGHEALEIYGRMTDALALVILDLIMPEMSGRRCLEGLRKINPQVKVLIASGYSADGLSLNDFDPPVQGFLNKPFELAKLRAVIREALDEG